jgi:hypothetical protein
MSKSGIAIITQALSSEFYFPIWLRYYEKNLGREAIYVITESGCRDQFAGLGLGGVITYPGNNYDEIDRIRVTAAMVQALLQVYKYVIIVDSDEIIVPDPRRWSSLAEFGAQASAPYYTCIGYDIVQVSGEPDLAVEGPVLRQQRQYVYATSSMCKSTMTRVPLQWGVGYHYASVYPRIGDLYLFHLKRSDARMQLGWMHHMSGRSIPTEQIKDYYKPDADKIAAFVATVSTWPRASGWSEFDSDSFRRRFLSELAYDEKDSIYRGKHFTVPRLIEIPDDFRGKS